MTANIGDAVLIEKPEVSQYFPPPPKGPMRGILISKAPEVNGWTVQVHNQAYTLKPGCKVETAPEEEAAKIIEEFARSEDCLPLRWAWCTGTDPEVFILDEHGQVIPAFNFLPAKDKPSKHSGGGGCFWDGFQAEFTMAAQSCHAYAVDYIQFGLSELYRLARVHNPKAELTYKCVMDLTEEAIKKAGKKHMELGCDPSQNAYGPATHLTGLNPSDLAFRFAGFHIHLGRPGLAQPIVERIVKALDAIVGVLSVSLFREMEDVRRRKFYGLAGEYRTPKHGIEWRALSSCAMCHPAVTHLLLDLSRQVAAMTILGLDRLWKHDEGEARQCVNDLDQDLAASILKRNKDLLEKMLVKVYGDKHPLTRTGSGRGKGKVHKNALSLIFDGAKTWLPVDQMAENWCLRGETKWANHSEAQNRCIYRLNLQE